MIITYLCICLLLPYLATADIYNDFLNKTNEEFRLRSSELIQIQWKHESNITQENEDVLVAATKLFDDFRKQQRAEIEKYQFADLEPYRRRQFEKFAVIDVSALDDSDGEKFKKARLGMESLYSSAKVSVGNRTGLKLDPELTELFAESTDEKALKEAWVNWRDATGKKMRDSYITYYNLGNKAAQLNKLPGIEFKTYDDLWMFSWETTDLKEEVEQLMGELSELYKKIHAYVRFHLEKMYPDAMPDDGTIPAHLLGNMWAQQWSNVLNIVPEINPHPDVEPIDKMVNENLKSWSIERMYRIAEKFFHDLGMENMTKTFWERSILVRNEDVNMTCHASAWDFYDGDDFRIKQCTVKTIDDLVTIHHEMGHIQYFMEYSNQPPVYREGANPGFHEAIGDLIALSVATPEHLAKINLLNSSKIQADLEKINLNYQMKMALEKISFLSFAYVMDKWRWDIFGDDSMEAHLNRHWWDLRIKYQGISPPVARSENDFDPGSKYHIPAGVEYVRYFASHVLQFQFYEHLCSLAGQNGESLYKCDFDGNEAAGKSLRTMLQKGSSEMWKPILKDFIGTDKMSLSSLRKYFAPLEKYLDESIAANQIKIGWENASVDNYFNSSINFSASIGLFVTMLVLLRLFSF